MTTDQSPSVVEYVTEADTARRVARAWFRYTLTRPISAVVLAVLVVFTIVWAALTERTISSVITAAVILVIVAPLVLLRMRSTMGKTFRRAYPVGATFSAGVGDNALVLWGPTSRSVVDYANYRDAVVLRDVVVLRVHASKVVNVLPRELLPGEAAELVRTKIAAANS